MKIFKGVSALLVTIAVSCSTESISPYNTNRIPTIDSLEFIGGGDVVEVKDTVTVYCRATDLDGDRLAYFWVSDSGSIIDKTNDTLRWVAANTPMYYQIYVYVSDHYSSASDSFIVNVQPEGALNTPPVIEELRLDRDTIRTAGVVNITCRATDVDDDSLIYIWTCTGGRFVGSGVSLRWVAPGFVGLYTIRLDVADGNDFATDSAHVFVAPDTTVLYAADFTGDQVTGRWVVSGLLSGLGENEGAASITWDSENKAMAVSARSNYGTYGFKLNGNTFGEGTFRCKVTVDGAAYSRIALLPKFIDQRNYILIGISPFQQGWSVVRCINGVTSFLAEGWDTFPTDAPIEFIYREANGRGEAIVGGRMLWAGAVVQPFNTPVPMGLALYASGEAPPALFDDFRVSIP